MLCVRVCENLVGKMERLIEFVTIQIWQREDEIIQQPNDGSLSLTPQTTLPCNCSESMFYLIVLACVEAKSNVSSNFSSVHDTNWVLFTLCFLQRQSFSHHVYRMMVHGRCSFSSPSSSNSIEVCTVHSPSSSGTGAGTNKICLTLESYITHPPPSP